MFAQVLEVMCPDVPYTSNGTWESVVFNGGDFYKPDDEMYELTLYTLTNAGALQKFREERNTLLDQSDKYVTPDYPHRLVLDRENWFKYRQDLRELPRKARPTLDENGNIKDVVWPSIPIPQT
jgi:hypothetical protein|tara:strand:+ start:116 stop:484 length:369 start_codon:yes stop_codon:yes gene_type:complete